MFGQIIGSGGMVTKGFDGIYTLSYRLRGMKVAPLFMDLIHWKLTYRCTKISLRHLQR